MTQQSLGPRRLRPIHLVLSFVVALAATLLGAVPAHASATAIDGTVYDATSGLPVEGVTVIVVGPDDVPESAITDAHGTYSIVPAYGPGSYDIEAGSDDYVWSPAALGAWPRTIEFGATLGATDFTLDRGRAITGTVRAAVDGTSPLAGMVVGATDSTGTNTYFDRETPRLFSGAPYGATTSDGLFHITVPLGDDYDVVAIDFGADYDPQGYDHASLGGCGCELDPVTVDTTWGPGTGAVPNIDFDLRRYADWTWISVLTQQPAAIAYPGVLVHLDRYDSGTSTWTLDVDSALSSGSGFVDLYGLGGGDYRLRYSVGGVFTSVLAADGPSSTPYSTSDGGKAVDLPGLTAGAGCGCGFDETDVDLTFAAPSSGGSGSVTPTTPRKSHSPVASFAAAVTTAPSPAPTPTATSTPAPTPSASEPGDSVSTPEPTSPTTSTGFDLIWLWVLIGIVLALIVAFLVVMFIRARRL